MLRFHLSNKREHQQFEHLSGALELGRGPKRGSVARCVIQDLYVSKDHVRLEEKDRGLVRVENLSQRNPVWFSDNTSLAPGGTRDCPLPLRLTVGETLVDIEPGLDQDSSKEMLETISAPVRVRTRDGASPFDANRSLLQLGGSPSAETLVEWFETVIAVQKAAAGSPEFYNQTAQAMINLVGLDRGLVLLRRGESWEVIASAGREDPDGRDFSHTILRHVVADRKTYFQSMTPASASESLAGIKAVVVSPIIDARDEVAGVLYGTRSRVGFGTVGIGKLQACVVQLLASAVGSGLARLEQEAEAGRQRVQFEQFFSSSLAKHLEQNPRLLEGQERMLTVMFTDIRGFSRLSESLTPSDICRLVSDVMDRITERVKESGGVVVDYAGDGMLAMWNAPEEQPDHAALACRAALAMQADLPSISADWRERCGTPLGLGIGINTGMALVGNTGSRHKFKYGPFGHTVNLASRVEGATKQLRVPVLITGNTCAQLNGQFATRRLCRVRVVGIRDAVDLYELHAECATPEWGQRRDVYEKALALFESGDWARTCQTIYPLLSGQSSNYDIPSLDLVSRSTVCLKDPPEEFDPVLDLKSK
jgi:adenylate cyclase